MHTNSNVKSRLGEFLKYKGIGQAKFAESVGLSRGFANNVGDSIRAENLAKITAIYPELNTTWLLTGDGSMLKSSNASVAAPVSEAPADSESVSIDRQAWEVIRSQAASLERKDKQVDELLEMLRAEMKRGDDADYRGHAATRAAAD